MEAMNLKTAVKTHFKKRDGAYTACMVFASTLQT